jgi:hypothetical protein
VLNTNPYLLVLIINYYLIGCGQAGGSTKIFVGPVGVVYCRLFAVERLLLGVVYCWACWLRVYCVLA